MLVFQQFPSTGEVMFGDKGQLSMANSKDCSEFSL